MVIGVPLVPRKIVAERYLRHDGAQRNVMASMSVVLARPVNDRAAATVPATGGSL
jgi:hypothetical protein